MTTQTQMTLPSDSEISKKLGAKLLGDVIHKEGFIAFKMNTKSEVVLIKMTPTKERYEIKVLSPKGKPSITQYVLNWSQWLKKL